MTTFQRARSPEQRDARRAAILSTAAAMLGELPVAQVSLNELASRVGLAKSNVLRYFDSREAVLLELLEAELADWLAALEQEPVPGGDLQARIDGFAAQVAASLSPRPVLCDLAGAQMSVLEHNVSTEVAIRHKRAAIAHAQGFAGLAARAVPELGTAGAWEFAAASVLTIGALWVASSPSAAVLAAYEAEPELTAFRFDFGQILTELLAVLATGLVTRGARIP